MRRFAKNTVIMCQPDLQKGGGGGLKETSNKQRINERGREREGGRERERERSGHRTQQRAARANQKEDKR